jgi:hypothetical protein
MQTMQVDNSFTQLSNKEIVFIKEKFSNLNIKIEDLMTYLNSKKIYEDFSKALSSHFTQTDSQGQLLRSELVSSERRLSKYQSLITGDNRIWYLNLAFFLLFLSISVLFIRILGIEKVKTLI